MRLYVGVTDYKWYSNLKSANCSEVNFWKPGAGSFNALSPDELFLLKLHKGSGNAIAGAGFFVKYDVLPTYLAWSAFGKENGTDSLEELNRQITRHKHLDSSVSSFNTKIGCVILTDVVYFDEKDYIPVPEDWQDNIVSGKGYDTSTEIGMHLYKEVLARMKHEPDILYDKPRDIQRYTESMTKHRLGQGAFRVLVTDAYERKCAVTGEHTLPVLEAAHIKPFSDEGPNEVNNGLLLRSDFHTLYDAGYIAITDDLHVEVSRHLHEDFDNGREYYHYHGSMLSVPLAQNERPLKEYLDWHNQNVYKG